MKIYIIYATDAEALLSHEYCIKNYSTKLVDSLGNTSFVINKETTIFFSKHGVGVLHATQVITEIILTQQPSLIIQIGIAGCYNPQHALGNVYTVSADRLADVGAQDNTSFISAYDLGLQNLNEKPYTNGWLFNTELPYPVFFTGYTPLTSITVNTASGNEATIALWKNLYKPGLETMEGAALHYACLTFKIPFVQLSAISNYVTVRNKSTWHIPLAIQNVNEALVDYIKTIAI